MPYIVYSLWLHLKRNLDIVARVWQHFVMATKRRIWKHKVMADILKIRVDVAEKDGFEEAAALAGISLSSWVRERLRLSAIRELESAGRRVPFIPDIPLGGSSARD